MLVVLIFFSLIFALVRLIFIPKDETRLIQNFALSISQFIAHLCSLLYILFHVNTFLFRIVTKISYKSDIITLALSFSFDEISIYFFLFTIFISNICIILLQYAANFKAFAISIFFFELLLLSAQAYLHVDILLC